MKRSLRSPVSPNARVASTRLERRLDWFAWTPAILWAATLTALLAPMLWPSAVPGSSTPPNATLRPPPAHTVFALNLLLFPGTALALSWFLALHSWAQSRASRNETGGANAPANHPRRDGEPSRVEPSSAGTGRIAAFEGCIRLDRALRRLTRAASITVGAVGLMTLILATLLDGEQTLALTLCIYAPSLAVAYGLLALVAGRMGGWWRVWLAGTAVGLTMLVSQLLYLEPDGRPPSEAVFALASLPIALAVGVWLVVWSIVPRPGLARVTP